MSFDTPIVSKGPDFKAILDKARKTSTQPTYVRWARAEPIRDSIETRKRELENDAFAQDIKLKRNTLVALFCFLAVETFIIFAFTFFQGFTIGGFHLEEWSFKLLVAATITQITVMLRVAVQHLFPQR